jgi:hypothetical protein
MLRLEVWLKQSPEFKPMIIPVPVLRSAFWEPGLDEPLGGREIRTMIGPCHLLMSYASCVNQGQIWNLSQPLEAHFCAVTHLSCGFFLFTIINCTLEHKRNRRRRAWWGGLY